MENKFVVGIDIGGTNTKFGIVDQSGRIKAKGEMLTTGHAQPQTFVDALKKNVLPLIFDQTSCISQFSRYSVAKF